MIFVTVGTHEQSFDRLVKKVDELVADGTIKEDVFIQLGYTKYKPEHCRYEKLVGSDIMDKYSKEARIVITHGGPGSIMTPFSYGKMPIVVPRQHEFGEHVDNHQMRFTEKLESQGKVLAVYDINKLGEIISEYDQLIEGMNRDYSANTDIFVDRLEKICDELVATKKSKRKARS